MIVDLGICEPSGKRFLEKRPHLVESNQDNAIIDFSNLLQKDQPRTFHKIFSISDALKINIGERLDERYPNQQGAIDNPAISLQQEIFVQDRIVVWSRAGQVLKTFDYSRQDEPIQNVLFAWFPVFAKTDQNQKDTGLSGDIIKDNQENEDTKLFETKQEDQPTQIQIQRRALCIVFEHVIKIHFEDGFCGTAHTAFEIGQVIPLDEGILINKKYIPDNKNKKSTTIKSEPDFYTVTHPLKGPCPVKILPNLTRSLPEPITTSHQVLFATTRASESGSLPVIVTLNKKDNRHYIWTYERNSKPKVSTKRKAYGSRRYSIPNSNKKQKTTTKGYQPDEEMLYENEMKKEIYLELLDTSEISIQMLWKETVNQKLSRELAFRNIKSEAFLVHAIDGEQVICIMNYTINQLLLVNLNPNTKDLRIPAKSAAPIYATRDNYSDLLYIDSNGKLVLFIDPSMPERHYSCPTAPITRLMDPVYDKCTLLYQDKTVNRYKFLLRPESSLVRDCFAAIGCSAVSLFPKIWTAYLDRSPEPETEWQSFFITLLSFLRVEKRNTREFYVKPGTPIPIPTTAEIKQQQYEIANVKYMRNRHSFIGGQQFDFLLEESYREGVATEWMDEILDADTEIKIDLTTFSDIIKSLHVVYEDYRIRTITALHAKRLGYLLMQCVIIVGNQDWVDYYESCGLNPNFACNLQTAEEENTSSLARPPNIQVCLRQMSPVTSSNATLLSYFGVDTLDPAVGVCQHSYAATIKNLWLLYSAMNHTSREKSLILTRMVENRITQRDINYLPEDLTTPISNILNQLKADPQVNWTKEAYNIIGRDDVYKQLQMQVTVCDPNTDTFKLPFQKDSDVPKNMNELIKECSTTNVNKCIYDTDVLNMETERLRFGFGGVIEKIRIMLDSTKLSERYIPQTPEKTDDELAIEHQNELVHLLQRTLSLSIGRAIYAFATHIPDITKVLPIEPFNTSAKILPLRTTVHLEEHILTTDLLNWPNFHSGVAAGLRISPSSHVNDSWIDFCCPPDLEPQHGGLLLAMGLNGVLKKLTLIAFYRFMTQTSELALIGFILAASVAYRATKEPKITKVLSVYIPALLLPDPASFNHSNMIQAAALLGMGLNFMNSCDRQMAASMLKEIGKNGYSDPSYLDRDYEGCALAAGFSLGFITLGAGDRALDIVDKELTNKLYKLMVGQSDLSVAENFQHSKEGKGSINLDVTCPGAVIALGLMYLKTENVKVAEMIEIPGRRPYLNSIRPDFMLLRVVAKNLIMWSTIRPTEAWIDAQLPAFTDTSEQSSAEQDYQNMLIDDEVIKQASYYIICGACLSMGLRFAGSRNKDAFRVLLRKLDQFMKLQLVQDTNAQQRITKCFVRTCVNVVSTAAAMVMAGAGNRQLVDRLEKLSNRVSPDMNYGDHMAISMSLGLLFTGLGGYTLCTTNEAIASLLCAFYPFYPLKTDDNRYHLQAFRHLWVMAVDSRWLMPFDVADEKPCRVPMKLELFDDDGQTPSSQRKIRNVRIQAPTVVPDFKLIKSIRLDGERYWPLSVDMTDDGQYQRSIIKSGVIYVKQKENKKSYEEDPFGLFTHFAKFQAS